MDGRAVFLIAILMALPLTQLLIWGLARHSTYVEFWRSIAVSVVGVLCGSFVLRAIAEFGISQIAGFALGGTFATWIITGWLYEFEIPHRVAVSLATPVIGVGTFLASSALCGELMRQATET